MLTERLSSMVSRPSASHHAPNMMTTSVMQQRLSQPTLSPASIATACAHAAQIAEPGTKQDGTSDCSPSDGRDPGVSDAVWLQLQEDKQTAAEAKRYTAAKRHALEQAAREDAHNEAVQRELEELIQKEMEENRKEQEAQAKLKQMGTCQMGYP